jgi:hypothetical protein
MKSSFQHSLNDSQIIEQFLPNNLIKPILLLIDFIISRLHFLNYSQIIGQLFLNHLLQFI